MQDDDELSEGITGVSETFETFSIHCVWSATLTPANIPSRLDCLGFFFAFITGSETKPELLLSCFFAPEVKH